MSRISTPTVDKQQAAELETRIWLQYYKAIASKDPQDWSAFTSLVRMRSPQQVSRMERAQGIE